MFRKITDWGSTILACYNDKKQGISDEKYYEIEYEIG